MGQAASDGWIRLPTETGAPRDNRPKHNDGGSSLAIIGGLLATGAAVTLAAVLTLIFAATLVVASALSIALIAVYAVTHRRRPQGVLIEARKVGHSWVAYGWDQRPR